MRGIGNHTAPANMFAMSLGDNTSAEVDIQVKTWAWADANRDRVAVLKPESVGIVINYEAAREIAAWWADGNLNLSLAAFASTGTILPALLGAIDRELSEPGVELLGSDVALKALRAYVEAASC